MAKRNETRVLFAAAQRIRREKLERITKYTKGVYPQSPLARRRLAAAAYKDCIIVEQVIEEMRATISRYRKGENVNGK